MELSEAAKVTVEEIRQVVDEMGGDPDHVSAAAVRKRLGRGSLTTIHKVIVDMRDKQRRALMPSEADEVPEVPEEIETQAAMVWGMAWATAMSRVQAQINTLAAQRDDAQAALSAAAGDIEQLTAAGDEMQALIEQQAAQAAEAEAALTAQIEAEKAKAGELAAVITKLQIESEKDALRWDAERATLQGQIERLEGVVADLRGYLRHGDGEAAEKADDKKPGRR